MSKPVGNLPTWATDAGALVVEPTALQKGAGYVPGDKPKAQNLNWTLRELGRWVSYLNGLASEALTWTAAQVFGEGFSVAAGKTATFGGPTTFDGVATFNAEPTFAQGAKLSNGEVFAFATAQSRYMLLDVLQFRGLTPGLAVRLYSSTYARLERSDTASVQRAFVSFELPVGAVITGMWLNLYHEPTSPVDTQIAVQVRKLDPAGPSAANTTPGSVLSAPSETITASGGLGAQAFPLTLGAAPTQTSAGTRFLVELQYPVGGEGSGQCDVTGLVVQYEFTQITR